MADTETRKLYRRELTKLRIKGGLTWFFAMIMVMFAFVTIGGDDGVKDFALIVFPLLFVWYVLHLYARNALGRRIFGKETH